MFINMEMIKFVSKHQRSIVTFCRVFVPVSTRESFEKEKQSHVPQLKGQTLEQRNRGTRELCRRPVPLCIRDSACRTPLFGRHFRRHWIPKCVLSRVDIDYMPWPTYTWFRLRTLRDRWSPGLTRNRRPVSPRRARRVWSDMRVIIVLSERTHLVALKLLEKS